MHTFGNTKYDTSLFGIVSINNKQQMQILWLLSKASYPPVTLFLTLR